MSCARLLAQFDLGRLADLELVVGALVTRYLGLGREKQTRESIQAYLSRFEGSQTDLIYAIVDQATDRHIGNVTLNRIHPIHRTADTGLMIGCKEFWGKGYAVQAWALLIDYGFNTLQLHKVIAGAIDGHWGSLKALKRLGFQEEGRLREEYLIDGAYRDVIRMGLLAESFVPQVSAAP